MECNNVKRNPSITYSITYHFKYRAATCTLKSFSIAFNEFGSYFGQATIKISLPPHLDLISLLKINYV